MKLNINRVYTHPKVMNVINNGRSVITGNFTLEEASDLAGILNAGSIPKIQVRVIHFSESK